MSRSYKHTPGWTESQKRSRKCQKRFANKRVRKSDDVSCYASYKKLFCSYNICDFKFLYYDIKHIEWREKIELNKLNTGRSYYRKKVIATKEDLIPRYKYFMK